MRKLLLTALLSQVFTLAASAYDVEVDGIYYYLNRQDKTASIGSGGDCIGPITIPRTIIVDNTEYAITHIGAGAFKNCSSLTSIVIPNTVIMINRSAFSGCVNLTSVSIPESVNYIDEDSFYGCNNIQVLYWDNMNCNISSILNNCKENLKTVVLGEHVTSIGRKTFANCTNLTSVTIPVSVTSIESYSFENCYKLVNISIPESVVEIGDGAFAGCESLPVVNNIRYADTYAIEAVNKEQTAYVLKEGTKWIESYAFRDCDKMTSIIIPESVIRIGSSAFEGCCGLYSVVLPKSITKIESNTFYGCSGLTSITLPESLISISWFAFYGCSGLTSIHLPKSLVNIEYYAFAECNNLTEITVSKENPIFDSRDNCNAIIETSSNTLILGCKKTFITNSITNIGPMAFLGCIGLTSVFIPNSVTSIGMGAFYNCSELSTVIIPKNVTSIGAVAFYGCNKLTSVAVEFSTPLELISGMPGSSPTYRRNHMAVKAKDNYVGDNDDDDYITFSNSRNATLYVPAGSKAAYESADQWKDFKEIVEYASWDEIMRTLKIESSNFADNSKAIAYDLNGRQLSASENLSKGIYIMKGRKIVVK